MRTLLLVAGSQVPVARQAFEEAIGDSARLYGKDDLETRGTDILSFGAYTIHSLGEILVDLPPAIEFVAATGPHGDYEFGKIYGAVVHKTPGLDLSVPVKAELRVKASHPINRPFVDGMGGEAEVPRVSYLLTLELSPAAPKTEPEAPEAEAAESEDEGVKLILEKEIDRDACTVDTKAQTFVWNGACYKVVPTSYVRPTRAQLEGQSRGGGRGGHQGGYGGGRNDGRGGGRGGYGGRDNRGGNRDRW